MSLDLTPEQKATGKANFEQAVGDLARGGKMNGTMVVGGSPQTTPATPTRRDVLRTGLAAGAVIPVSAAVYFGYESLRGKAVKTALIGCGDEGGVLVGEHNPEFNEIVAVCDIRPSNLERIFKGDSGPRKGLNKVYGEASAAKIEKFENVDDLLAAKSRLGLEAVIIATPLNTHDPITKKCLEAGLHVLCEKLMARSIGRCKAMIKAAKDNGRVLSIGHQRHYSTLYAQALEVLNSDVLGDIKFIRALWHRNNSWPAEYTAAEKAAFADGFDLPKYVDGWYKPVLKKDAEALPKSKLDTLAFGDPKKYGFKDVAELIRWRISESAGGGLMAELGSHQLDASSIILGHARPLAVTGVGGKWFYGPGKNDRESMDSVFVTYEFPGRTHPKGRDHGNNPDDIVVVTYSSMNTNEFESYGEWVMGSKGTMFLEKEASVYLWREKDKTKKGDAGGGKDMRLTVGAAGGGKPTLDASSTWGGGGTATLTRGPAGTNEWDTAVRGYRTEMEHFAYCIRQWGTDKVSYEAASDGHGLKHADKLPRCHGEVAMADAIVALTANMAMEKRTRIEFEDNWFKPESADVPETKYGKPL
ncbi:Gfo/Idh/MocA family protein [Urbifossiella limnaea]|uniref:Glucose--fructose oxidoreductase n=1 Tax=Urbifossiella limnaea TaxID=2528023 RepID=A0A517XTY7_9BACT|nr:Gfo/Idh/MocA family oxidoreductase [Urbifossiella limnaea]QDU20947.1 Glucose--fructose oxidoreductase precursor [Urbifossiella limnaea]